MDLWFNIAESSESMIKIYDMEIMKEEQFYQILSTVSEQVRHKNLR